MPRIPFPLAPVLLALPLVPPAPAAAQVEVVGVVQEADGRDPVRGVELRVQGLERPPVLSDAAGRFALAGIPAGVIVLVIRHPAYAARTDTLEAHDGQHLQVLVRLTPQAVPLAPIAVEARSRVLVDAGFYDRRARGFGAHFTREQIAERASRRLSDLLAGVAGIRRSEPGDGVSRIHVRGTNTIMMRCDVQYFIDGVAADIQGVGVDAVRIEDLEGVEVYRGPSEMPPQFNVGRSACGAILLWTRMQ